MKKINLPVTFLFLACVLFLACSHKKVSAALEVSNPENQVIECGNMSVTIPDSWTSSKVEKADDKLIMVENQSEGHQYMIMEMEMNAEPEYIMKASVVDNPSFNQNTEFGKVESCKFHEYDACYVEFFKLFGSIQKKGKAVAFCHESRSYIIIAQAFLGETFEQDVVFDSFRLTGKEKPSAQTKSTREQINDLIKEFQSNFGTQVAAGVTFDNMELSPDKDCLTLTYGITAIRKSDFDEESIKDMYKELKGDMIDAINQLARTFKVIQQCKNEKYTFKIKVLDKDKREMFSYVITPDDYRP